ncbi:MAG: hypothetical protein ABIZ81_10290 [Opitutaceae bacterium]
MDLRTTGRVRRQPLLEASPLGAAAFGSLAPADGGVTRSEARATAFLAALETR